MTSLPVHKQMRITSKRSEIDSNFINLTGLNRGRAFRIRHFYFSMTSSYSRNDDDVISGLHKKPYSKETTTGTQKVTVWRVSDHTVVRALPLSYGNGEIQTLTIRKPFKISKCALGYLITSSSTTHGTNLGSLPQRGAAPQRGEI